MHNYIYFFLYIFHFHVFIFCQFSSILSMFQFLKIFFFNFFFCIFFALFCAFFLHFSLSQFIYYKLKGKIDFLKFVNILYHFVFCFFSCYYFIHIYFIHFCCCCCFPFSSLFAKLALFDGINLIFSLTTRNQALQ